jgi:hypothetical protein
VGAAHVRAGGARRDRWTVVLRLPAVLPGRAAPGPRAGRPGGACVRSWPGRYLEGFGPASAADLAQFTLLTRSAARGALDAMAGQASSGGRGRTAACCSTCPARRFPARTPVPVAADGDVGQRPAGLRRPQPCHPARVPRAGHPANGDVLPTLLVDGHVAGVWRPVAAASRRRRSASYPNGPGRSSPKRPAPWRRSWPRAILRSTAAMRTGGRNSPAAEVRLLPG